MGVTISTMSERFGTIHERYSLYTNSAKKELEHRYRSQLFCINFNDKNKIWIESLLNMMYRAQHRVIILRVVNK